MMLLYVLQNQHRGTPHCKKILRRVRDFAQVKNLTHADDNITRESLAFWVLMMMD